MALELSVEELTALIKVASVVPTHTTLERARVDKDSLLSAYSKLVDERIAVRGS